MICLDTTWYQLGIVREDVVANLTANIFITRHAALILEHVYVKQFVMSLPA